MLENLTAQQLFDFAALSGLSAKVILLNLAVFLAGVFANVFQKMKQAQVSFKQYWTLHGWTSLLSLSALATSFLTLLTATPAAPLYAYFSVAYVGDALINKVPAAAVAPQQATRSVSKLGSPVVLSVVAAVGFIAAIIHLA